MKKTKLTVLASSVLAAALLTGCSNSANDKTDAPVKTRDVQVTDSASESTTMPIIDEIDDVEESTAPDDGRAETTDLTVEIEGEEVTMPATLEEGSFNGGPGFNIYMDNEAYTLSTEDNKYKYSLAEPGRAHLELQFIGDITSDEYLEQYKESYSDVMLEDKGETNLNDDIKAKMVTGLNEETDSTWTTYIIDTNDGVLTLVVSTATEDAENNGVRLLALAETLEIL